ncbi:MAG: addiction module protein [Planctomycetota bacterium]
MTALARQQLLRLEPEEKLRLIGDLWDSLDDADIPELTPAQKAELERRVQAHELHPEEAVPWDVALEQSKRPRK